MLWTLVRRLLIMPSLRSRCEQVTFLIFPRKLSFLFLKPEQVTFFIFPIKLSKSPFYIYNKTECVSFSFQFFSFSTELSKSAFFNIWVS